MRDSVAAQGSLYGPYPTQAGADYQDGNAYPPACRRWMFAPQSDGTTFVSITEAGFTGDGDELVKQVTDSTRGFSLVLAGLKALLEQNVRLNLVADRYPTGIEAH